MRISRTPTSKSGLLLNSFDPILCRFFRHLTSGIAKQLMKFEKMILETDPPVNLVKEQQTLSGETVFGVQASDKF
ncbi:Uncharacterized protein TCM_015181 [Theobroma cacao]|uniref:Uncharacterized protein n=1 Tax=Theobroma cacao TaxID=3641 RepID=A0A061G212_THECC|nr:Uncharacterized protein TCM_015181 [Theobroma cacao]